IGSTPCVNAEVILPTLSDERRSKSDPSARSITLVGGGGRRTATSAARRFGVVAIVLACEKQVTDLFEQLGAHHGSVEAGSRSVVRRRRSAAPKVPKLAALMDEVERLIPLSAA